MTDLDALCLGEETSIRGHRARRVGLCGDGAYLVDGEALSLEAAAWATSRPVSVVPPPPERKPRARPPSALRSVPELLEEVRETLGKGRFRFQHRAFIGGEAVEVWYGGEEDVRAALQGAQRLLLGARFHVEWSGDRLVVAANAAALAPPAASEKKRPAA